MAASLPLRKVTYIGGTARRSGAAPQAVGTAGWGVHCRQGYRQGHSQWVKPLPCHPKSHWCPAATLPACPSTPGYRSHPRCSRREQEAHAANLSYWCTPSRVTASHCKPRCFLRVSFLLVHCTKRSFLSVFPCACVTVLKVATRGHAINWPETSFS